METRELFNLAGSSLFANKLRSFLTMLGIIIGVFAIIMLVSVATGLQSYITNQISGLGSNLVFVIPGRLGGARTPGGVVSNKLTVADARFIEQKIKTYAQVAPVISSFSTIKYSNKTDKNASILGTTANYPKTVQNTTLEKGVFFSQSLYLSGAKVAVIGQTVKENLFDETDPIGKRIFVGNNIYTVIGVLKTRGALFGIDQDNVAVIPLFSAQRQFGINNVNAIYISVDRVDNIPTVVNLAKNVLLKHLTEDDFTVQTAEAGLSIVGNITNILSLALGGIAAISLLVGGIGVANIMLVSVTERTREIGLRKALGAKRIDILKQFLLEAVILSVSGGLIGIALGLIGSYILAQILVSTVTPWSILLAFFFSILVGVAFGMAPAIRASRLSPIEALRHE